VLPKRIFITGRDRLFSKHCKANRKNECRYSTVALNTRIRARQLLELWWENLDFIRGTIVSNKGRPMADFSIALLDKSANWRGERIRTAASRPNSQKQESYRSEKEPGFAGFFVIELLPSDTVCHLFLAQSWNVSGTNFYGPPGHLKIRFCAPFDCLESHKQKNFNFSKSFYGSFSVNLT